ncbi:hypothetical protein N7490_012022 [Penicillium lividum]|nr:hypothetical protein N7490_012022 [Penicillium lividum]
MVPYCSVDHQKADRPAHKVACSRIKRCREDMQAKEEALRDDPEGYFTHNVGIFWKIHETRPYMQARAAYTSALSNVFRKETIQAQLDVLMGDLQLCRGDNMGSRELIPGLMIRLNKDQESYDFLKWWATKNENRSYDWSDMSLPYLDIKDANVLEPVDSFIKNSFDLPHLVMVTLLKIRVLWIIMAMIKPDTRTYLIDMTGMTGSNIINNSFIASCQNPWDESVKIKGQIRELYDAVNKMNPHFWPALVNPGDNLDVEASMFAIGSKEQMQSTLQMTWEAWSETFGAIDAIEQAVKGKKPPFSKDN